MSWPGILILMPREQRAVILIVLTLLAAAIAKKYYDRQVYATPAPSPGIEMSPAPAMEASDEEDREPGE